MKKTVTQKKQRSNKLSILLLWAMVWFLAISIILAYYRIELIERSYLYQIDNLSYINTQLLKGLKDSNISYDKLEGLTINNQPQTSKQPIVYYLICGGILFIMVLLVINQYRHIKLLKKQMLHSAFKEEKERK